MDDRSRDWGDPEDALTDVDQVVIGPDEQLYVPQEDDGIRVYDRLGEYVKTIGHEGEGPGEFRSLGDIGLRADTLYAVDSGRWINMFSLDGELLRTWPWRPSRFRGAWSIGAISLVVSYEPGYPQHFVYRSDGTALVYPGLAVSMVSFPDPGVFHGAFPVPFVRFDQESQVVDTVVWEEKSGSTLVLESGGEMFQVAAPFNESPLFRLAVDGSCVVMVDRRTVPDTSESTFTVTLIAPAVEVESNVVFSRTYRYHPTALDDEEVRRVVGTARVAAGNPLAGRVSPDALSATAIESGLRDAGLIPATQMPVTAVATGQDGSIWLRREEAPDTVAWDVLDAMGDRVGSVRLPAGQTVLAADDDLLVALDPDAFDVPYLIVYRLRR